MKIAGKPLPAFGEAAITATWPSFFIGARQSCKNNDVMKKTCTLEPLEQR